MVASNIYRIFFQHNNLIKKKKNIENLFAIAINIVCLPLIVYNISDPNLMEV